MSDEPQTPAATPTFRDELRALINRMSMDSFADTPDYVLAEYLDGCLNLWDETTAKRDKWFGFEPWARIVRLEEPTTAEIVAEKRADDA